MTETKRNKCETLFNEYKELQEKTALLVHNYKPGKSIEPQSVSVSDIIRKEEIRQELLKDCREYLEKELTPEQIFEVENG